MNIKRIILTGLFTLLTFSLGVVSEKFFLPEQNKISQETDSLSPNNDFNESGTSEVSNITEGIFPGVLDSVETISGRFEIVETDYFKWKLVLAGSEIVEGEGLPPAIAWPKAQLSKEITDLNHGRSAPKLIVLTQASGTYCEFERFWFLEIKENVDYHLSNPIGHGFAYPPEITDTEDTVTVSIRGGRENNGSTYLPGGVWVFDRVSGRNKKVKG